MAERPKIAAITTVYHKYSHAQHIVDRFLEGYGWNGHHHRPDMDLVSLYVDQVYPDPAADRADLSRDRAERFPQLTIYPTVADVLTLGGSNLAIDGVLLIGEHGDYDTNEKGQHLYPRYGLFKQIVSVYRTTGKTAPVFNDKHLSWNWDWCREMYDISLELGFALMAGSSLPVTWRIPSIEMPLGTEVEEAVCVGYGGVDSYDFHALETLQCMVERRKDGETGVKWLNAYLGEDFWDAHAKGIWSHELFEACLCRSHTLNPARLGFNNPFPTIDELKHLVANPIAYHYEHNDGLRSTMILMNGLVQDFNFAARLRGRNEPLSTQMYLPMPPTLHRASGSRYGKVLQRKNGNATLANFFTPLTHNIEQMFLTGKATYPVERTLLTSGLVIAGVDSLYQDQVKIDTPHLKIAYQATEESTFWRT